MVFLMKYIGKLNYDPIKVDNITKVISCERPPHWGLSAAKKRTQPPCPIWTSEKWTSIILTKLL